ncbi:hypothetical protein D9M72_324230 [compost metagenome]
MVGHHIGVRIAVARHGLAGHALGDDRRGTDRHHRVEQRHVDMLALAGAFRMAQRGQHRHRGIHAGEHVDHRDADLLRPAAGQVVALAGDAHQAAEALEDEVVAGLVRARPGLAVARDRAVDDGRVDGLEAFIVQPVALQVADLVVLQHDLRPGRQFVHDRLPFRAGDIQRHRLLAAVGAGKVGGVARRLAVRIGQPGRPPRTGVVAGAGALHLDDLGPQVGQVLRAPRSRQDARQVEHPHALKGAAGATGAGQGLRPRHLRSGPSRSRRASAPA